jgi:L-alanine-DL-glutamate epimerase-like enolase superfamily enzyme
MKVAAVELTHLDLPFTARSDKHLRYWIPAWRIVQICKLTLDNGIVGWGETILYATHARIAADIEDRIVGQEAASLLWHDDLGAGLQLALFDAVGKNENVSACDLLGKKLRDWCPISWWACDMGPEDWAQQCQDAVSQGYMSAKFKSRPWQDLHACLNAGIEVVPPQFKFDLDFNGHLVNSANAIPLLKSLEQYEQVAMIETPIPQRDITGNVQIRGHIHRPLAMHFDDPPIATALREDVTDGLIIGGGAAQLLEQDAILRTANKPLWLQLVGTGITTTWAAHIAAVCTQARWPSITCMNIYESQLLAQPIEVRGGYYKLPEGPGLGIEVDLAALQQYEVNYTEIDHVRHIYKYQRSCGETVYIAGYRSAFHGRYTAAALPICERGSTLDIIDDDGSQKFSQFYDQVESKGLLFERSELGYE